jgi:uncharacterized protein with HEPN domain
MRREKLYLTDIVEACESIGNFCKGVSLEEFQNDDMRRSAVLQKLIVIGEAAAHLPGEFIREHPGVPWVDVVGLRNFAVHEYFSVKWDVVWLTATEEVRELLEQSRGILRSEFGD